jgi:hypothetical protein
MNGSGMHYLFAISMRMRMFKKSKIVVEKPAPT